jgi:hypothetical protein
MRRQSLVLIGIAGAAILACHVADATAPDGSAVFDAPAVYSRWWQDVEQCSGLTGDLSSVRWYMAPTGQSLTVKGQPVDAYWASAGNFIVLSTGTKYAGSLIRHEMLHALARSSRHTRTLFLQRCAGVVVCTQTCVADAEPIDVPTITPRVPPDSIDIWSTIEPSTPTSAVDSGFFTVTVWARNHSTRPVVVTLPPSGDAAPSLSFSYRIDGETFQVTMQHDDRAWDPGAYYFLPGETKREVFDMVVREKNDMAFAIAPGVYQLNGAYGQRNGPTRVLPIGH